MYELELQRSRANLLRSLQSETDPVKIYRLQGEIRQLWIMAQEPQQIEVLDKLLIQGEEYARMKYEAERESSNV